jgi:ketosteroid isomerase-like protein
MEGMEQSENYELDHVPEEGPRQSAEQLIRTFYTNFQQGDWKGMLTVYHPDIFFYDPVFGNLESPQVAAMWEMLLSSAWGLDLQFGRMTTGEGYGSCYWTATYLFTSTGRKVVNKGKALFKFSEGKIIEHHDDFSLWEWSAQALGWRGLLFGWTSVLQNKVRQKARNSLERFMGRKMAAGSQPHS